MPNLIIRIIAGLAPLPGLAQAPDSVQRVAAVQQYLEHHGRAAYVGDRLVSRYEIGVTRVEGCSITVHKSAESASGTGAGETSTDLSDVTFSLKDLHAAPRVQKWDSADIYSLNLESSTGDDVFVISGRASLHGLKMEKRPDERGAWTDLPFSRKAEADSAASVLGAAIRACGGRAQSPAGRARIAARRDSLKRTVDVLLGATIPAEQKAVALKACQSRIRDQLRAPSEAKFSSEPTWVGPGSDNTLMIIGTVEAQNGFGGFRSARYLCTFEKLGEQWVPKSAAVR
jgi:hypothetical protein